MQAAAPTMTVSGHQPSALHVSAADLFSTTPPFAFASANPVGRFGFGFGNSSLSLDGTDDLDHELSADIGANSGNGGNSAAAVVSSALAAHHLSMLAAVNRGSPDSLPGFPGSGLGLRSNLGSENGNGDGSETSFNDENIPLISFSLTAAKRDKRAANRYNARAYTRRLSLVC